MIPVLYPTSSSMDILMTSFFWSSEKGMLPTSTFESLHHSDEKRSLLILAGAFFDSECTLSKLPRDIITLIILREQHERRILSRSHYRICFRPVFKGPSSSTQRQFNISLQQYEPKNFTPDLISKSVKVLNFLHRVRKLPMNRNNIPYVEKAIRDYFLFLLLQQKHKDVHGLLFPSLEIQAVWFTHMLQSCPYTIYINSYFFNRIWGIDHPLTRDLTPKQEQEQISLTQRLWAEEYPENFSEFTEEEQDKILSKLWHEGDDEDIPVFEPGLKLQWVKLQFQLSPNMVIDDQDWILEFRKFTYGIDVESRAYLEKIHVGYQRFLKLKHKYAALTERIGLSPCPSVDLIWHTHLIHPCAHTSDMKKILGIVPKHKLIDVQDRTEVWMDKRNDEQLDLWQKEFSESIFEYANENSIKRCPVPGPEIWPPLTYGSAATLHYLSSTRYKFLPIHMTDISMGEGRHRSVLDSMYTYLNAPRILLDIVDDAWAEDRLPEEDEELEGVLGAREFLTHEEARLKQATEEQWTDLGLDGFPK